MEREPKRKGGTPGGLPFPHRSVAEKIVPWAELLVRRAAWREAGLRVVWTNGCFDLVHAGHAESLAAARALGDVLVVGLNSDASVRALKGPGRPLVPERYRRALVAALGCVDFVALYDEQLPTRALRELRPDVHCKGADYAPPHGKPIPEREAVEAYGGRVAYLPLAEGLSTTDLVRRIRADEGSA